VGERQELHRRVIGIGGAHECRGNDELESGKHINCEAAGGEDGGDISRREASG
jgi:hypothetical protein